VIRATLHEQEIRRAIGEPGDGDRVVDGAATIDTVEDRCLFFVNHKVVPDAVRDSLAMRRGCIAIARRGFTLDSDCVVIESSDPRAAISRVLGFIRAERRQPPLVTFRVIAPSAVISPLAVIEGDVDIGDDVVIEPFCMIGPDVRIGRGSIIRSGVRLHPRVTIGEESVIHANSVLGHDGYGFVRDEKGNKTRMPHLGGVIIGSHVALGPLASVAAGTIMPTIVEDYAKLGDYVCVGHNVRIGRNASLTAQIILGGHSVVEAEAWVGLNATIGEGRRVGAHALVGMDVSVQSDLPENSITRAPRPDVQPRPDDDDLTAIGFSGRRISRGELPE
jgi:UDP-3-O-[3-hydroxymyristoyl] glucosamine N-acyltransferase